MKKSFKKVVAILLAVLMMVCSFPLTALAADGTRANIKLQFGSVTNSATNIKNYTVDRTNKLANFSTYSGMNSDELTYSNGAISGYGTGDFFTISVLVENISQISATEIAVKYSDAIEPAYLKGSGSTGPAIYTDSTAAYTGFGKLEAITAQSGNAIYNTTSTVGETSYIDEVNRVMHANFAVQTGADAIDLTSETAVGKYTLTNSAIIATFMFKIVNSNAITFSIDTASDTYYLDTIANGGSVDEYKTYAPKVAEDASTAELDFMGKNEYVGSTTQTYTITFVDADGQQISSAQYEEGAAVIAPQLPAVTHDDTNHYTYAWDVEPEATATKNATYTIVKTGAAHTWDAGVTTKEPTATEAGEKTFTCTFNGCGATKTESLPATGETHTHTWGDWKYNGDAVYVSKTNYTDGTITRTCSGCGETETQTVAGTAFLRTGTYALVLDNSLTINFRITKANVTGFNNITVKATTKFSDPNVMEFAEPTKDADGYYQYLIGLPPQYVKDDINVVAYSTIQKDGQAVEVWGPTYTRSVLTYANAIFGNSKYTSDSATERNKVFRGMIVDILNYATAAQVKANYEVNDKANANLTDTQKSWASADIAEFATVKNFAAVSNPNRTARFAAGALSLEDAVIPRMTFALKADSVQLNDITVEARVAGEVFTYTPSANPKNFADYKQNVSGALGTENRYYFFFTNILANQMSQTIEFRIYANGVLISDVCTYSVESYVQQAYPIQGQIDKDLLMSMMKYGKAAEKFGTM